MISAAEANNMDKDTKRQNWLTHIKQWEESKLSQQAYCIQSGINLNSFTHWRGKFLSLASREVKAKFLRVKMDNNHAMDVPLPIKIKLLTGHVVYIPTNLDINKIAKLINLLGVTHA